MQILNTYKIILRLNDFESEVIEIEAKSWKEVSEYVFGRIEIINTEE